MKNFILKIILKINGTDIFKEYKSIIEYEKKTEAEKIKIQNNLLKDILLYSSKNIPYYKKVLKKAGVIQDNHVVLENFHKIPILTKDTIRSNYNSLHIPHGKLTKRKSYENTSGGSTGEPVKFIQDRSYWTKSMATKWYFYSFLDSSFPTYHVKLWGSEKELLDGNIGVVAKIKNWIYNRDFLNSFMMSEEKMSDFIGIINKKKPNIIEGYVQSIYELAKFIKKNNLQIYTPPGGIITSAGTLYPEMESLIKDVFHCNVINRYGTREVGDIACSKAGSENLEVNASQNYVEILNNNLEPVSPGEAGAIYITTLNNFSMPLIRYKIGDIGIQSTDKLKIKRIEGREMSVFKTKSGKIIPGEFFIHFIGVVYNNGGIKKIQVIQEDFNKINIKTIIRDKNIFNQDKKHIIKSIQKVMGLECNVSFEIVQDIQPLPSGKYLYTISKIK